MTPLKNQVSQVLVRSDYCYELELQHLGSSTIDLYKERIEMFYRWLAEREPSARLAKVFLAELRRKRYSGNTIRGYYTALKPYLSFIGIEIELALKREETLPAYHTRDDIQRILDVINSRNDNWRKLKDRDRLIIRALTDTGVRRAELLAIKASNIKGGYLFVRKGKGNKDRVIRLTRNLRGEMDTYIHTHNLAPADLLFPMTPQCLDSLVKGYALKAGLDDVTPHKLRHYFATRLIEKHAELKKVQQLMGHGSIETTAIYLDVLPQHLDETIALLEEDSEGGDQT